MQKPQQALNIALSEYAPGRLVVVNKKTYRVGSVAANSTLFTEHRAEKLFGDNLIYIYCPQCLFAHGISQQSDAPSKCPLCGYTSLSKFRFITPEVVYPEQGKELDEYDDEQTFTYSSTAQLQISEGDTTIHWQSFSSKAQLAFASDKPLVMVNKGELGQDQHMGFWVCTSCGKTVLNATDPILNANNHSRDYFIKKKGKNSQVPERCAGSFENVYLGYQFNSDVSILRITFDSQLRFDPIDLRFKQPLNDALQSLAEAITLAVSRLLDIDIKEINAGYRFHKIGNEYCADIYIYDTLSGGSGYASLAGQQFDTIFDEVGKILDCTHHCSTSCTYCLQHYGNRLHHHNLDRFLARDLYHYIKTGVLPIVDKTIELTTTVLRPLLEMLKLDQWYINDKQVPITVSKNGRDISLAICSSLATIPSSGFTEIANKLFVFSKYELSKDLPGAYSRLVS